MTGSVEHRCRDGCGSYEALCDSRPPVDPLVERQRLAVGMCCFVVLTGLAAVLLWLLPF